MLSLDIFPVQTPVRVFCAWMKVTGIKSSRNSSLRIFMVLVFIILDQIRFPNNEYQGIRLCPGRTNCCCSSKFSCLPVHGSEKLLVALGSTHAFEQFIHGFFCVHVCEVNPQKIHALEHIFIQEEIITAG